MLIYVALFAFSFSPARWCDAGTVPVSGSYQLLATISQDQIYVVKRSSA